MAAKKASKEAVNEQHPEDRDVEFFTVLVFRDSAASEDFLRLLRIPPAEKYISGEMVMDILKRALAQNPLDKPIG